MSRGASHPVVHLELHTPNLAGACALNRELFAWKVERVETTSGVYVGLDLGSGLGGGVVECDARRPIWLPYVEVAEISAAVARARELGATVALEPREGPAGWRAVISSPAGGELALWQPKG